MNNNLAKGYALTIIGALVLAAAAMIVLFNSGPVVEVRLFNFAFQDVSLGVVMVLSGLAGAFVLLMAKYMVVGIWSLWKGRREKQRVEKQARKMNDREGKKKHADEKMDQPKAEKSGHSNG